MFYENLENILKEKNLTLNKLAKGCEIAQSPTSRWKTGTLPSLDTFTKICKYLNVSADYLLDLDEEALPPPHLSDQEEELLKYYRQCKPDIKKSIMLLASSGAQEATTQETPQESSNLRNIG